MRKLRIILDSDGVLAHTMEKLLEMFNAEYGQNMKLNDLIVWDLRELQPAGTDMLQFFDREGFFADLKPWVYARSVVRSILKDGHEIIIATASPPVGVADKAKWFARYFPSIPEANIIYIQRKDLLKGDIMLDDGLHNLKATACDFPIVFDQPWNREGGEEFLRVSDWLEVKALVDRIAAGASYQDLKREQDEKSVAVAV